MAKSRAPVITVKPKSRCCRSRKRCKRCPVVLKKARSQLIREGVAVGPNPRMIQLTSAPQECKAMRKRLEKAIAAARD